MATRVVLLPFDTEVSFIHVVTTIGGDMAPETKDTLRAAKQQYDYLVAPLSEGGYPTDISVLKKHRDPNLRQAGALLEGAKLDYDAAKRQRDEAIKQRWNKIDHRHVICKDSENLVSALRELKNADDTLYIRGHCVAGSKRLRSADKSTEIGVDELIEILDGKLHPQFSGKIKIFACQSALDTKNEDSFAKRFATSASVKWTRCTFYGYTEDLSTYIRNASGHKTAAEAENRASDCRVHIPVPTQHQAPAQDGCCTIL